MCPFNLSYRVIVGLDYMESSERLMKDTKQFHLWGLKLERRTIVGILLSSTECQVNAIIKGIRN